MNEKITLTVDTSKWRETLTKTAEELEKLRESLGRLTLSAEESRRLYEWFSSPPTPRPLISTASAADWVLEDVPKYTLADDLTVGVKTNPFDEIPFLPPKAAEESWLRIFLHDVVFYPPGMIWGRVTDRHEKPWNYNFHRRYRGEWVCDEFPGCLYRTKDGTFVLVCPLVE